MLSTQILVYGALVVHDMTFERQFLHNSATIYMIGGSWGVEQELQGSIK